MRARKRKAISPVIATVILIAITLIASIAIAGFVFGLFGSFTSTAQVSVTAVVMPAKYGSLTSTSPATALSATGLTAAPTGEDYIALTNTGTAGTSVTGVSLTIGGQTYVATVTEPIGGSGSSTATVYIQLTLGAPSIVAGTAFTGIVTLANGGQVPFSGSLT